MDGTLIDSSPAVVVAWETMKESYPFIDLPHILRSAHGYRTVDALRKWVSKGHKPRDVMKQWTRWGRERRRRRQRRCSREANDDLIPTLADFLFLLPLPFLQCLIEDEELLAKEVVRFEDAILAAAKAKGAAGGVGIIALPGVARLLEQLSEGTEERCVLALAPTFAQFLHPLITLFSLF